MIMQMSVQKIIIRLNDISLVDAWCPMVLCERNLNGIRMVSEWYLNGVCEWYPYGIFSGTSEWYTINKKKKIVRVIKSTKLVLLVESEPLTNNILYVVRKISKIITEKT